VLAELVVTDLGVIHHASVVLGPGLTALTGETGAGKTLVVEAIDLLLGGRADAALVRAGADEARVDGRFLDGDDEVVLSRVVARAGRARAYIDGRPVTVAALSERSATLLDLHGQHAHQTLLAGRSQRDALDAFGGIDTREWRTCRSVRRALLADRDALGGDERARAREIDLLRFQVRELADAAVTDPDEDAALETEEEVLTSMQAHREALASVTALLGDDDGILTQLGAVRQLLGAKAVFADAVFRVKGAATDLDDLAAGLRAQLANLDEDPARLTELRQRRHLLRQLRRKYGESLSDVIAFEADATSRLAELHRYDERAATIEAELRRAATSERVARDAVAAARRQSAGPFADAVSEHLSRLALANARFAAEVHLDEEAEDSVESGAEGAKVTFVFSANPGSDLAPLAKVASGGELARVMLALQLALLDANVDGGGRSTLIFDEVDAGIGGETALSVGDALAELGSRRQVLVVTHLAQVAASADAQVHVRKTIEKHRGGTGVTSTVVTVLSETDRVEEVARMLAGDPASPAALRHAEDLLGARRSRRGDREKKRGAAKGGRVPAKVVVAPRPAPGTTARSKRTAS
jgi:DNA repair protein RecN (Recombination protein N)